jgi:mono/diheme cytochrome c family protein
MKRNVSCLVGLSYAMVALAFMGPAGARTPAPGTRSRVGRSAHSSHQGSGRQVYMRNCARCHGANGQGKSGPKLTGKSLSLDAVAQKVTDGGTQMPSFKKQLSPTQVKAVAAYVQSLSAGS